MADRHLFSFPSVQAIEVHGTNTIAVNHIFDCAIHTFAADHARSAAEMLRRYDLSRYHEPAIPCSQHPCRVRPETAYALFGEIADILRTNPNIDSGHSRGAATSPEETVARIVRYARIGSRPRQIHPLISTTPFAQTSGLGTPDEIIRRAHVIIGEGGKAALYRHHGWNPSDEQGKAVNEAIKQFNAKLRHIRDYLAIADTANLQGELPGGLLGYTLLAGDRGIVVILIRRADHDTATEG